MGIERRGIRLEHGHRRPWRADSYWCGEEQHGQGIPLMRLARGMRHGRMCTEDSSNVMLHTFCDKRVICWPRPALETLSSRTHAMTGG
jgi:hypothetical protein